MSTMMKVLIAYDGSSCADAALNDLSYAGLPQEVEARILSVADVFLPPPSSSPGFPRPRASGCPAGMDPRHPRPRRRAHPRAASAYTSPTVFPYLGGACRSVCRFPRLGDHQKG